MAGRTAEIAGGGIAGLGLGAMLARLGWAVRVHEQRAEISELGAGIYLKNTPLRVLDRLGVKDRLRRQATPLKRSLWRDGKGAVLQDNDVSEPAERVEWVCRREAVIEALASAASDAGVEVVTDSKVASADPNGTLVLADATRVRVDLVVAADGHGSVVRGGLGLTDYHAYVPTLATRFLVPNRTFVPDDSTTMYWSGNRRVGIAACGEETYVFLITPQSDELGKLRPIDVASWTRHFPVLAALFEELSALPNIQHNYVVAKCKRWSDGRVAIVGDAAHALPPILGQGAGLALSNGWALSRCLEESDRSMPIPEVLQLWESQYRRFADTTQRWAMRMDKLTRRWPRFVPGRAQVMGFIGRTPAIQRQINTADTFATSVSGLVS